MRPSLSHILLNYLALFFLHFIVLSTSKNTIDDCKYCRYLTRTFADGLNKTQRLHFGGGNTDWEERKLGKFKTSEARFVEVMEMVCKKDGSSYSDIDLLDLGISSSKEQQFKCQILAEKHEEDLEHWFFKLQEEEPDVEKYLCVDQLKTCCQRGHFGEDCAPCPGIQPSKDACFNHGKCEGSGTRSGSGSCSCVDGYVGKMCSNCASNWFAVVKNETFIECAECFDGCASGCTFGGPKGCNACRSGYEMDPDVGCKDIDECQQSDKCTKSNEICVNTPGSYECKCAEGYRHNDAGDCEIDVQATPKKSWFRPDELLRIIAITGLILISAFVLYAHRSTTTVTLTIVALVAAIVIDNYYEQIFPSSLTNTKLKIPLPFRH